MVKIQQTLAVMGDTDGVEGKEGLPETSLDIEVNECRKFIVRSEKRIAKLEVGAVHVEQSVPVEEAPIPADWKVQMEALQGQDDSQSARNWPKRCFTDGLFDRWNGDAKATPSVAEVIRHQCGLKGVRELLSQTHGTARNFCVQNVVPRRVPPDVVEALEQDLCEPVKDSPC